MNNLNTSSWQEYLMSDLFEISGVGSISNTDILDKGYGEYPYVTRTEKNNGIKGFFDYKTAPANVLTIETTLSGLCFYHNYEFSTGDHIMVLYPKSDTKLNKYTALFIKTIWKKNSYKYGYSRPAIKEHIQNTKLILPTKNNRPDWECMENYIKSIETKINFYPIKTKNKKNCYKNWQEWGEFSFIDKRLWSKVTHGQRLIAEDRIDGDIDYYSASEFNNSQTDKISNPLFIEKNCIVYNTFASAFYVENEFTASDEVYCFHNDKLNKYNALFITTIMNKNKYKFQFGRKAFYNKFCNETIKLPITKTGDPDWQYMEDYIRSLPYADLI